MIESVPKHKRLILFDGVCNLCNTSVLYVIKRDKSNVFLFAPLQSKLGQAVVNEFNIDTNETDSILLYNPEVHKIYSRSTAALKVSKLLNFPVNLLSIFLIVPVFIRDMVYNFIAKNRYKWFGKKESCMIPTPELKAKFLD